MKITVNTIDDREYILENLIELNFTQTAGVACDCFSAVFKSKTPIGEIVTVKVWENDVLVFNGYCDNQKITEDKNGFEIYFYARSTASLLVDNEAQPFTYNKPTANQLCFTFAKPLGFECELPNIKSDNKYEVTKGTSCFGAVSQFVSLTNGGEIYVTPQNSIKLYEKSTDIKALNSYRILSACSVINRSEPLSEILFKRTSSSAGYNLHTKAQVNEELRLNERKQYVNLTSLPQWQREYAVFERLKSSFESYKTLEITVAGYASDKLYQRFSYSSKIGDFEDYILVDKKYTSDKKGKLTRLTLKKEIDLKEITYVD